METEPKGGAAKYIAGIIIIGLVIIAVSLAVRNNPRDGSSDNEAVGTRSEISSQAAAVGESAADTGVPAAVTAAKASVLVEYTDSSGFTPDNLSVRIGDTVTFVNKSSGKMWVGSDVHPTHTEYDGTALREHCATKPSAAFDQCETGQEYSLTFTKVGSWKYHNHSRASMKGLIVVK